MRQIFTSCLLLLSYLSFGQNVIKGTVTDATERAPLVGVTVAIEGTNTGAVTNIDGEYTIEASDEQTLVFSFIGFKTVSKEVGNQRIINVAMQEDVQQLGEVVVTALGIEKETKALGYAVQEVDGESLEKAKEPNFVNSLSGRVAGLQIKNSTDLFQNPEINLRGSTPLLVIDGIPDRTLKK